MESTFKDYLTNAVVDDINIKDEPLLSDYHETPTIKVEKQSMLGLEKHDDASTIPCSLLADDIGVSKESTFKDYLTNAVDDDINIKDEPLLSDYHETPTIKVEKQSMLDLEKHHEASTIPCSLLADDIGVSKESIFKDYLTNAVDDDINIKDEPLLSDWHETPTIKVEKQSILDEENHHDASMMHCSVFADDIEMKAETCPNEKKRKRLETATTSNEKVAQCLYDRQPVSSRKVHRFSQETYCDVNFQILPMEDHELVLDMKIASFSGTSQCESLSDEKPFENPWPHLEGFFKLKCKNKDNKKILHFQCQKCLPTMKIINVHATSLHNLKSHFKRAHPLLSIQFEEAIKAGSGRGKRHSTSSINEHRSGATIPELPDKKVRQLTIGEPLGLSSSGTAVRQSIIDEKIVRLFVNNILPLHVVESREFVDLVRTLNPDKVSMSRHTLYRHIDDQKRVVEEAIINTFDGLTYVATTADCWTTYNRSFLGMTAHWIDPITRERKHAVLTCTRLTGRHTYDVLTKIMVQVHERFNIQDKVVRTTIDNGANFVKAFAQYGGQVELLPDLNNVDKLPEVDSDSEDDSNNGGDSRNSDDVINIVTLGELLDEVHEHRSLPVHMRCAAHTFNLVASVDLGSNLLKQKGTGIAAFNALNKKAHGKAQALFNAQRRSTQIGDAIEEALGKRLMIPSNTRWNALYDSIVFLNNILAVAKTKTELNKFLLRTEKLSPFNDQEIAFLMEWVKVMSNVAIALDIIQREKNAYLGTLLPTVAITLMKLESMKGSLTICKPMVDALVEAINNRFDKSLKDRYCQLAAAFHPKFRLHWLHRFNSDQTAFVREAMENEVERALRSQNVDSANSSGSNMPDDFFVGWTASGSNSCTKQKAKRLVNTWLDTDGRDSMVDSDFMGEELFINLFLKYNTSIPSSAAVERLFSLGKDILRPKRARLAAGPNFEKLVFLKGNQHIVS